VLSIGWTDRLSPFSGLFFGRKYEYTGEDPGSKPFEKGFGLSDKSVYLIQPFVRERKDLQFFSCWTIINGIVLSFPPFFAFMRIQFLRNTVPLKSPDIVESEHFFPHILHPFGVLREYAESI
jgi:hypothetical protein